MDVALIRMAEVERLREDYAKLRDALEHVSESEDRLRAEVERLRSGALDQGEAGLLEVLAREEIARHKCPPHALLSAHEKLAARADRSDIPNGPRFDPSSDSEDS